MMRYLFLALLLTGCGWFERKHEPEDTRNDIQKLYDKVVTYRDLNKSVGDSYGYIHSKCDGVGFTSLCKVGGACESANIFASESSDEPGRWYRYPTHDCYPGESKSDDSNDHALMRFIYFVNSGNKDAATRQKNYLEKHSWKLGENNGSQEGMEATQFAYFTTLIDWVGGKSLRLTDQTPIGIQTGFRAHLQVLYAVLQGMVYGKLNSIEFKILEEQAKRQPRNALFQAAYHRYSDGVQDSALSILLDESLFPADRLPSSSDRCEEYLFQRDEDNQDWKPCSEGKTHSGTDLLFAAWVLGVR